MDRSGLVEDLMTAPELERDLARDDRERRRAQALRDYGVLDAPERRDLIALVTLAAQVSGVPMATLNLLSASHQHQVASYGFEGTVSPRGDSMCAVVLDDLEPLVLADASLDERFSANPWVTGTAHVRFYATHQLITPSDIAIGSLCVFDTEPRRVDAAQVAALAALADRVVDVLELELRSRQLARAVVQLQGSEEELMRSNLELGGFAGQISHDLRGPLAAILSAHELLAEALDSDDPDRARWLLGRADQAGRRMSGLLEGTLAYASAGGHRAEGDVDLAVVVDEVRADLAADLAGAELSVGALPTVRGDGLQLRVVLQNLIANAVKFTRPGEPARVELRAQRVDLGWRIAVVDHGVGLADGDVDGLFEPYRRGADSAAVEGTGLGLATSKKIVVAHGGSIGLEPTPGGGATAWFELPDATLEDARRR